MRGRMMAVEGLDGTGKTTLSKGLARSLGAVWMTTPPSAFRGVKSRCERMLCSIPEVSQLFHGLGVVLAAREARDHLDAGRDVVMDRYWLSTAVYGAVSGSRIHPEPPSWLVPPADVTVYVEIDEGERRSRLEGRGLTYQDRETLSDEYARELERTYRRALETPVAGRVIELDVTGLDPVSVVEVAISRVRRSAFQVLSASESLAIACPPFGDLQTSTREC